MKTEITQMPAGSRWDYRITVTSPLTHIQEQTFVCGGMAVAEAYAEAARNRLALLLGSGDEFDPIAENDEWELAALETDGLDC